MAWELRDAFSGSQIMVRPIVEKVLLHACGTGIGTRFLCQQIEIYFSIVQRKVLTPNDFPNLAVVEKRVLEFQQRYEEIASPFEGHFTRDDLNNLLAQLATPTKKTS